ncbi:hypothetical protein [Alicyclobacillus acidoterrestris]|uniref:Uncharacterized protein n=1 Tax=Alicyclobacillus acidoterrestris (strain ATCC 49025 / DSM 3922 / CIP 106132 / NCIMB 13137 / GD3B) TaxID=1356854 RepID=T0BTP9_ALIAG|nr:hypothetical protein [Alicyclobacillus acidoterrestris]EPZ43845.1 hypothetical protein N007_12060 [Alicyclobacillus acidoterrestris ATCC 49025]UNO49023.1 hypothetical protein K1I37_00150 [Alicyclobacillus acidoterrestris]
MEQDLISIFAQLQKENEQLKDAARWYIENGMIPERDGRLGKLVYQAEGAADGE